MKKEIINALKMQQEMFGDDLLISRKHFYTAAAETQDLFKSQEKETVKWESATTLEELNAMICNCTACPLHKGRNKFVFGKGNPNADVMVIGEGPGADEDAHGEPFIGRAGKLLTDILAAIKFTREEVYIANIVKCRPPGNRTPDAKEIETCIPYLHHQINLIKPSFILLLGTTAAHGLLQTKEQLGAMRGKVFSYGSAKVMVTYHPAALLRNPNWKRGCWEDVQEFRKMYDDRAGLVI